MEKHDIWIQINPKPTHDCSLWMNQMKMFGIWQSEFVTDCCNHCFVGKYERQCEF